MRLALTGLIHEANTFAPGTADLGCWLRSGVLVGEQIRDAHVTARSSLAGFFGYEREDPEVEMVPLVYSQVTPTGVSTSEAFDYLAGRVIAALDEGGPWDGVLMPLHGAAVSEKHRDADGELLRRVRAQVGKDVPIGATLDMHANVSHAMIENADVITLYQTNPHVDAYEQGLACTRLIGRTISGEIQPAMALTTPPLAVDILRQGTADEPMAGLLRAAREHERRPGVLATYVSEGFPYADVAEMGMSILAITDNDPVQARDTARALAETAWQARHELVGEAPNIDDALKRADSSGRSPIVLLDTGDNVGGGSPGDSTHVLHAARRLGIRGIVSLLTDPTGAARCWEAGVGGRVSMPVGGKTDDRHGAPLPVSGVVTATSDGRVEDPTPTHGGIRSFEMGLTARLSTDDGFELILTSRPQLTRSLEQLRLVGLEPGNQKIIVAKGVHSPRAAFEPIAAELVWAASPGCTSADLSTLTYSRRPRPMFPFETETIWP